MALATNSLNGCPSFCRLRARGYSSMASLDHRFGISEGCDKANPYHRSSLSSPSTCSVGCSSALSSWGSCSSCTQERRYPQSPSTPMTSCYSATPTQRHQRRQGDSWLVWSWVGPQRQLCKAASLLRCNHDDTAPLIGQLGCPTVELPITYLGIQLTLRIPTATQLQPVIDNIASRLLTWKAGLMSKPKHLAMIK
jgi:hypothetical protein